MTLDQQLLALFCVLAGLAVLCMIGAALANKFANDDKGDV